MTVDQVHSPSDAHSKDENNKITSQDVGLIFAREYYTFLNKRPDRLYAFYGSDSLLVRGDEGETVSTVKGQKEIAKKIEELEFDNCKVLVTQVDSLLSANDGILISVLGEMSNKGKPSQKFAETFFLAPQFNGYYILNNIFRYLKEKVDIDYYLCQENEPEETHTVTNDVQVDIIQPNSTETKELEKEPQTVSIKPEESNGIEIKKSKKEDSSNKKITHAKDIEKKPNMDLASSNLPVSPVLTVQEKVSIPPTVTPAAVAAPESVNSNASVSSDVELHNNNTSIPNNTKRAQPNSIKENESQLPNGHNPRDQRGPQKTTTNSQTWARLAAATTNESANEPNRTSKTPQQHHYHKQQAPPTQQPMNTVVHTQNNSMPHGNNYNHHPQQNNHHHPQQHINNHHNHVQNQHHSQLHYQHHNKDQQHHQNQHHYHQRNKETTIFVKNVSSTMTEEQLEQAFIRFGPIKNVYIGHSGNIVFIDFIHIESKRRALEQSKVMVGHATVHAEEPKVKSSNQFHNNNNRRYPQNRRGGGSGTANRGGGTAGVASLNKRSTGVTGSAGQK